MELIHRDGLARIAKFKTNHGTIETPTILPVINPNLVVISPKEMLNFGAQGIITNSYIIKRNEKLRNAAEKYGVHSLLDFDGPIMTDSGTFQSYVYGDVEYSNSEIIEFQKTIGSDVITILDIFSKPDDPYEKARGAVMETYDRMKSVEAGDSIIAGTIQGSIYPDLRKMSAEMMSSTSAGYLPIGGVVPLLENYEYDKLAEIIITSKLNSHFGKPIHLFGGGHPMFMPMAVMLGVDLFDSASYIKYARDSRLLFSDGTRELKKISSFPDWSPLRDEYTVRELLEASAEERTLALAKHNLSSVFNEINEIKERIFEQTLWQYVEAKSRSHPYLFKAFLKILEYSESISYFEDLYKKPPFYFFDAYSNMNPIANRMMKFTHRFLSKNKKNTLILPTEKWKPKRLDKKFVEDIYEKYDVNSLIQWNNMLLPIEFEETYPLEQVITSSVNDSRVLANYLDEISPVVEPGNVYFYNERDFHPERFVQMQRSFDLEKIRAIADFQFGIGVGKEFFPEGVKITKSRATGRIRNIILDGVILATMRAHDGFFTLTVHGASRLRKIVDYPKLRVVVTSDSAEYNSKGFNVFFKFIMEYDPGIIALNETLVVDEQDNVVAVGRSTVSGLEMGHYNSGVAVKVHHGIES